ncbi:GTPase domain-containing protein [bacterium]|nr:GTPase domain-containing protein [candidate division CSSED10-310 bacterium]
MPKVRIKDKEIVGKIVFYGPGLGGKTTNMQFIHKKAHPQYRGDLVSLATETDRTLFFDFLPMAMKQVGGFDLRFHMFTVPGQVFYEESRKIILKGADGVVFVADSHPARRMANEESFDDLKRNLQVYGLEVRQIPMVIQYNKRDLPNAMDLAEMRIDLNYLRFPDFEAVAVDGKGVIETFQAITRMVLAKVQDDLGLK